MQQFLKSVSIALLNIRANPLHTFLSTLGIIIGVAALVGILALGDGLEQTGREQLANTTSLNILTVSSVGFKEVKGVRVQVEDRPVLSIDQIRQLQDQYRDRALVDYIHNRTVEASSGDSLTGIYLQGNMAEVFRVIPDSLISGRLFTQAEIDEAAAVAVLSYEMARRLSPEAASLTDQQILMDGEEFKVVGILSENTTKVPQAYIPVSYDLKREERYPQLVLRVERAEEIPQVEQEIREWMDKEVEQGSQAFSYVSNKMRIEQFSQGILLFKIIMGAITGISVLVGGIGVMNVLLISVTERTKEIGIRKATGAKKKDIILQFMAESVTISLAGCIAGWVIGMAGIFIFVPIVNAMTEIGPFRAAIGGGTVFVILIVALLVGVIFGTYPAWRAAQLTPVDAIRHE